MLIIYAHKGEGGQRLGANIPPWLGWGLDLDDIAIHEAAHVVAAYKFGFPLPSSASIVPQFHYGGHVDLRWFGPSAWGEQTTAEEQLNVDAMIVRFTTVILSGYVANFRLRRVAKAKCRSQVQAQLLPLSTPDAPGGLGEELDDLLLALHCLKDLAPDEDARKSLVLAAWDYTWGLVRKWWPDIKQFAGVLTGRKTIVSDDLIVLVYETLSPLTGGRDLWYLGENWKGRGA